MREGAADFLCKPFDLRALRAVLDRLLGSQATRRPPDPVWPRTVRPAPVSPGTDLMHILTLIDSGEWEAEAAALAPARSNAAALSRAAEALEFAIR